MERKKYIKYLFCDSQKKMSYMIGMTFVGLSLMANEL